MKGSHFNARDALPNPRRGVRMENSLENCDSDARLGYGVRYDRARFRPKPSRASPRQ